MPSTNPLPLSPTTPLILDGALATELEARGLSLATRLWSAAALASSAPTIRAVHASYYAAGATVATTASYQASLPGLRAAGYTDGEARALVEKSVEVAREARDDNGGLSLVVAGSVGPYGAFLADGSEYTGRYALSKDAFKDFHRGRVAALLAAGADALALETMPNRVEIEAVAELLRDEFPHARAWLGVTVRRRREAVRGGAVAAVEEAAVELRRVETGGSLAKEDGAVEGEEVVLSDGSGLKGVGELVRDSEQVVAVGVNCVPQDLVVEALRGLREGAGEKACLVYPNSGEVWDAEAKVWREGEATDGKALEDRVREWWTEGARWIGGCCRMGPKDIKVIRDVVEELQKGG
ncbi:putative homocysteine s-methyltransferase [Diplodia seriata]|uniref:Homocysteine S-methyltransferase n=1 Tax=Diplodia seriata TaxID=420778 RepID=A0A0G2F2E3_9PEZI|nr:putative homocysteine s-methyltransferase [Diplodia seriata]OMP88737.1 Homocysteine S-methyltransferase [Diplodia seriata]